MQLQTGTTLRDYKIKKLLGKGGMGTVYLAKDSFLDRYVAIKELNPILTADADLIARFRNEAKLQAKLTHLNIVSLYSFFEQNGRYYIVMEYAEGKTLKEVIRQTGPITETRAIDILKQILSALEYAHGMEIIHRDIKPSNIILDGSDRVKILDFGIARILGERGLTQTGQQLGTVAYMSPEQVKAEKDIDSKTDVYSLGVTLFEMLSGRMPYDLNTESDFVIMNKIVHDRLPDPRDDYPYISDKNIDLLAIMTEKDRHKRADIVELELYLSGKNYVGKSERRKEIEAKEVKRIDIKVDSKDPGDATEEGLHVQKNKKESKNLLWIIILISIILGVKMFSKIDVSKNHGDNEINSMIFVEGGSFEMGSDDGWELKERPIHDVTISSFWIDKYQVTQKEWKNIMRSKPSKIKSDNLPVQYVSWYDAIEYCNKRSIKEGLMPCYSGSGDDITCNWEADGYRLPTEAEWEYAARGGNKSRGYKYAGSNTLDDVAWCKSNSQNKIHPIGQKSPNELGIYDMSGNVCEWCWDWYDASYYSKSPKRDPHGPDSGKSKILRGGSWEFSDGTCRVAKRYPIHPLNCDSYLGFRVVRAFN
ncbi:MAG TPA: SUMF1/EgtB/PvdO family nonheme iron enzyme [Candidatus Cloacimonetes bacterium]|nr:SUMF1/EgtB/PvdO family nonheme iron enzyme [Candidatus Cloacimonadota bacterium]